MNNTSSQSKLVRQIIEIAHKASEIVLSYYDQKLSITYKNNDSFDPLTMADKASDDFIRQKLHELFPEDEILSEENNSIPTDYSKRIWMIDPLDGTKEFLNHTGGFAINIGLWSKGEILFGLVYTPITKRLFYAEKTGDLLNSLQTVQLKDFK